MAWHITFDDSSYETARESFEWSIPDGYTLPWDLLEKHEDPAGSIALSQGYPDGRRETYSFRDIDRLSNRLANGLSDLGVGEGDRVVVVLSQKPENLLTHLAAWKLGAATVPLSILFGTDALRYRIDDSDAVAAVVDAGIRDTLDAVRDDCPDLEHVLEVDGDAAGDVLAFDDALADSSRFDPIDAGPGQEAIVMYTSGTTGPPKGVLHTRDCVVGHCTGFYMQYECDVGSSVFWTPSDWAWAGALFPVVFPAWHYGRPLVGYPKGTFDPEEAFAVMEEFGITDTFIPPTALRMMMEVDRPGERYDLDLDVIASAGEPVTPEILDWADRAFDDVVVNEIWGRTEGTNLVCNCRRWFEARPGSMGKPAPGHEIRILDPETGGEVPRGEIGEIAVRREGDPALFVEYLNKPERTAEARTVGPDGGEWDLTGDLASMDEDGYIRFKTRDDDLIMTAGYRVGPGEVERAILDHDDVQQAGVIGVPDETRGEIIKAYVQPMSGIEGSDDLREEIRDVVRENLAQYEYPREIEFADELPTTTTGKIQRRKLREWEETEA